MDSNLITIIEQLSDRVSALEHTVNDVIIEGWRKADEQYKDQEAYSVFSEKYGPQLEGLKPYFVKLYGDDFDLPHSLYDELKKVDGYGTDGFDEDFLMKAKLDELHSKFDGWDLADKIEDAVEEVAPGAEVVVEDKTDEKKDEEPSESIPSVDELKEIYKNIGE